MFVTGPVAFLLYDNVSPESENAAGIYRLKVTCRYPEVAGANEIFATQDIKSISIVHMQVPCCSGIEVLVRRALEKAQKNIIIKDYTISISGEII